MNMKTWALYGYILLCISAILVESVYFKYCREIIPKRNKIKTTLSSITSTVSSGFNISNTSATTTSSNTNAIKNTTRIDYSNIYPSCNTGFTITFLMHNPLYNFTYCQCDGIKMIITDTIVCDRSKLVTIPATSICNSSIDPALASANSYFTFIDNVGYYRVQGNQLNDLQYCNWSSNKDQTRLLMSFIPSGF